MSACRKEREASRAPEPGGAGPGGQGGAKTEDIAFSILQRKEREGTAGPRPDSPEAEEVAEEPAPATAAASSAVAVAELQLTDWEKLACLLCARQFQAREKLQKHNTMSDLHTRNLEEWRARHRLGGAEPADDGLQYRDRAKERRNKYGDEDVPAPNKFKEKYKPYFQNSQIKFTQLTNTIYKT
jgi:RNA-binding protein 5/10